MSRTKKHEAQTGAITVAEAKRIVAKVAKMKDVTPREAELMLIASGYRRLSALWRYSKKEGK